MTHPRPRHHPSASTATPDRGEDGIALITVIMMLALISALTMTLAMLTTNNLASARLAQQAGAAVDASDAGVAQAVAYMRANSLNDINACSPTCASNPWGNEANPATVSIPGKSGQTYKVWIEPIAPFPANDPGTYRIHSTGAAGGPAGRTVTVDATIGSYDYPLGIMSNSVIGGGDTSIHQESIFTTGCVYKRSQIKFTDGLNGRPLILDPAYGIPPAVHSSQYITDDQGSGQYCSPNKPIHDPNAGSTAAQYCNSAYPYDQDLNGGPLTGTTCYQQFNGTYPTTSLIKSDADLAAKYGVKQPVFTQSQLDQLKSIAISQGNYYNTAAPYTAPTQNNAVMYFDLTRTDPGDVVDLTNLTPQWTRPYPLDSTDSQCQPKSLVVIIEGGNARFNSNSTLYASVFLVSGAPYGQVFKSNGTTTFIGTLYSNSLDLTGTADLYLDKCFLANKSPALTTVTTSNYREVDR